MSLRWVYIICDSELFNPTNDEADHPIRGIEELQRRAGTIDEPFAPHPPTWTDFENRTDPDCFLCAQVGKDWSILRWHGLGKSRHHFCKITAKEFFLF